MILTQEIVRELLDYNPDTGLLLWRMRSLDLFAGDIQSQKRWNSTFAGRPALATKRLKENGKKSRGGKIFYKWYNQARVIWLWMTGQWPKQEIDHVNRNGWDNRWNNLRDVSSTVNCRNRVARVNNNTGVAGVTKKPSGSFLVQLSMVPGQKRFYKTVPTFVEAVALRRRLAEKYGYAQ